MVRRLGWPAIHGESIAFLVNSTPIGKIRFERCLDFPVLYKVFDQVGEAASFVVRFSPYRTVVCVR